MTPKTRLIKILNGEPVDGVAAASPVQTGTVEFMEATDSWWPEAHKEPEKMAKLALAAYEIAGIESVRVPFDLYMEAEAFGCEVGKWSKESQPQLMSNLIDSKEQLDEIEIPDPKKDGRFPAYLEAIKLCSKAAGDELPVIARITTPLALVCDLIGFNKFQMSLINDTDFIIAALKPCMEFMKSIGKTLVEAGADAVMTYTYANTETMGLDFYYKFAFPYEKELIQEIQSAGSPVIIHNCSHKPAIEAMIETTTRGISVDHFVDMAEINKIAKGRVALFGNLDPMDVVLGGSPDLIREKSLKCIEDGVNCSRTPTENLKAIVKAAKDSRLQ